MSYKEKIIAEKIPRHIAIIMDGNGRWAQQRGSERIFGHRNAYAAVKDTVEAAAGLKIDFLTLFAFSTENWERPETEVDALMSLLLSTLKSELNTFIKNNVRFMAIGNLATLPLKVRNELDKVIRITAPHTGLTLILALSYGSRWEITEAVKKISFDIKNNKLQPEDINTQTFQKYLTTSGIPDPELLIRTSGEYRISNFLLYQIAYSELYFTETLWPDFRREDLYKAICNYQSRERRFGKTSEQCK